MSQEPREVLVTGTGKSFRQDIDLREHRLVSDEPERLGGTDEGPDPYELLLAALGSCTSMTIGMYARRKEWPVDQVQVRLRHQKIHAKDCADCDTKNAQLDQIERIIEIKGPLSSEQRARLLEIADKCPVHRTLTSQLDIVSRLAHAGDDAPSINHSDT